MRLALLLAGLGAGFALRDSVFNVNDDVKNAEKRSIQALSFTPTKEQIRELIGKSQEAECDRKNKVDGSPLLSKVEAMPKKADWNPWQTILATLPDLWHGKEGGLAAMYDLPVPLLETSSGPNAVLVSCDSPSRAGAFCTSPEEPRINLFYGSVHKTKNLLDELRTWRLRHETEIFNMFLTKLEMGLKPDSPQHFKDSVAMFQAVKNSGKPFRRCGIHIMSFCQTWMKRGEVGNAEFSVMSPHFQTRFSVAEPEELAAVPGVTQQQMLSYSQLLDEFTEKMKAKGYEGAFVNLENIASQTRLLREEWTPEPRNC